MYRVWATALLPPLLIATMCSAGNPWERTYTADLVQFRGYSPTSRLESLEWATADSDLIVRGTIVEYTPGTPVLEGNRVAGMPDRSHIQVLNTLKGQAPTELWVEGLAPFGARGEMNLDCGTLGQEEQSAINLAWARWATKQAAPTGELLLFLKYGAGKVPGVQGDCVSRDHDGLYFIARERPRSIAIGTRDLRILHDWHAVLDSVQHAVSDQTRNPATGHVSRWISGNGDPRECPLLFNDDGTSFWPQILVPADALGRRMLRIQASSGNLDEELFAIEQVRLLGGQEMEDVLRRCLGNDSFRYEGTGRKLERMFPSRVAAKTALESLGKHVGGAVLVEPGDLYHPLARLWPCILLAACGCAALAWQRARAWILVIGGILVIAAWALTYRYAVDVEWGSGQQLVAFRASVTYADAYEGPLLPQWCIARRGALDARWDVTSFTTDRLWKGWGLAIGRSNPGHSFAVGDVRTFIRFPLLPLALVVCAALVYMSMRRFCNTRSMAGRCPSCGYDLRATPHRCPECGLSQDSKSGGVVRGADASSPTSIHHRLRDIRFDRIR